jgi:hypothetical protein
MDPAAPRPSFALVRVPDFSSMTAVNEASNDLGGIVPVACHPRSAEGCNDADGGCRFLKTIGHCDRLGSFCVQVGMYLQMSLFDL